MRLDAISSSFTRLFGLVTICSSCFLTAAQNMNSLELRKEIPVAVYDSLANFAGSLMYASDSINHLSNVFHQDSLKLDSLQDWYHRQQNKIKHFPQSKKDKLYQLDTLQRSFDNKKRQIEEERAKRALLIQQKEEQLEERITKLKQRLPGSQFDDVMPGPQADQLPIPQNAATIPPAENLRLPNVEVPALPDVEVNSSVIPSSPILSSPKMPGVGNPPDIANDVIPAEITEAQSQLAEINELNNRIGKYRQDVDSINKEKAQKRLEEEAANQIRKRKEIKMLEKARGEQTKKIAEIKTFQDEAKQMQDTAYVKSMMNRKAKTLANEVLAKNSETVVQAQRVVSRSQRKYKHFSSLSESRKHPLNALHGVPFADRFFYGLTFQFQSRQYQQLFTNPFVYYKVTHRVVFGAGVVYRNQYSLRPDYDWITSDRLYGMRAFTRYVLGKSIFVQGDVERLYTRSQGQWSTHFMSGVGRNIRYSKRIGGDVTMLYNFSNRSDGVYPKQIVLRTSLVLGRSLR